MRMLLSLFLSLAFILAGELNAQRTVHVRGYTRRDGTYVPPHYRTAPNSTRNDNWSTRGNVNPYTGEPGTKPGDDYLTGLRTYMTPTATPYVPFEPPPPLQTRRGDYYAGLVRASRAARTLWWRDRLDDRWHLLALADTVAVSVNTQRWQRVGSTVDVWVRWDYRFATGTRQGTRYDTQLLRERIDCASFRVTYASVYKYLRSSQVDSQTFSYPSWDDVTPGTYGDVIVRGVCSRFAGGGR